MKLRSVIFVAALLLLAIVTSVNVQAQVQCGVLPQSVCNAAVGNNITPVTSASDAIRPLVEWIANILIVVFGGVAVLVIIISGVQISASAGNEEVVKKGKENIFKVVTGLILLISFRAILGLIDRAFIGVNTTNVFVGNNLNPAGIPLLISNVIGIAALAAGAVAVIMIIVGGIQYIASGGGDGMVKAKKTITYAISGLVISILAYTIVTFIIDQLQ